MTRTEAEQFLGVTTTTMTNLLNGGHFQSYTNTGVFSNDELMEFHSLCQEIRRKNESGDLSSPDYDCDVDPPLL